MVGGYVDDIIDCFLFLPLLDLQIEHSLFIHEGVESVVDHLDRTVEVAVLFF